MYANGLPFEHSFEALKANPQLALYPRPQLRWSRLGWRLLLKLPGNLIHSLRQSLRLIREQKNFARRFCDVVVPALEEAIATEAALDLSGLDDSALEERLERWIQRTCCDFARESLKPTVIVAVWMQQLEQWLVQDLGPEAGKAALGRLVLGAGPGPEADLAAGIHALA